MNRILFLKLLEAKLKEYHKENAQTYQFLHLTVIQDFDELNELFFEVLAKKPKQRSLDIQEKFGHIPYLNSSLFEITNLEFDILRINSLKDRYTMIPMTQTVLKNGQGKVIQQPIKTLHYLFDFLDAYDFTSDATGDVQEDNKTLISAAVLGLIFEKINGYQEGSFYTPSYITMYMCRQSIRKAVLQKFKDAYNLQLQTFQGLKNYVKQIYEPVALKACNDLINSLKICDPAVGSGHFLVSALNELVAIKSELGLLIDSQGEPLYEYQIKVENDELIVTHKRTDDFFEYEIIKGKPIGSTQRVQETLFKEKRFLIENCLFGVDINANSVKICQLRLWIELLKHAYYKPESQYKDLETLPNIDINIKCGNSLISRFALDVDISRLLKKSTWTISSYQIAIESYRKATNKQEKRDLIQLIDTIKKDFRIAINQNHPLQKQLDKLSATFYKRFGGNQIFTLTLDAKAQKEQEKLTTQIEKVQQEIKDLKNNVLYQQAFEWRFEFPEVLDEEGHFVGFDVVIGNPPYIRQEEFKPLKNYLSQHYTTYKGTADLLVYFVEKGIKLLKNKGFFYFIIANKFMRASYGMPLRKHLQQYQLLEIIDFGDLPVFEEATTYPCILATHKTATNQAFMGANVPHLPKENFNQFIKNIAFSSNQQQLQLSGWTLQNEQIQQLIQKLRKHGRPLANHIQHNIYRGIVTGYNKAFVIDEATKQQLIEEDKKSAEVIKPFLSGREIKKYQSPSAKNYLISFPKGWTNKKFGKVSEKEAFKKLEKLYPSISRWLKPHKIKAIKRTDKGDYWWELRACIYYKKFEKPKIIYPNILKSPQFTFDKSASYTNQKCFIIPLEDFFLLGVLNSNVIFFLCQQLLPKLRGGFFEPSFTYFKGFPIPNSTIYTKEKVGKLVQQILTQKQQNPLANTSDLEQEIDQLVYKLYGLTDEEIALVEESVQ